MGCFFSEHVQLEYVQKEAEERERTDWKMTFDTHILICREKNYVSYISPLEISNVTSTAE